MKKAGFNEPDNMRDFDSHYLSPYFEGDDPTFECCQCGACGDGETITDDEISNFDDSKWFCSTDCRDLYDEENHSCNDCEKIRCICHLTPKGGE